MFIDRQYKPWLACTTDDTRPSLAHVLIERLSEEEAATWHCNGVAVGANGYVLVAVPVELEPTEGSCLIHRRFWPSLLRSYLVIKGKRFRGDRAFINLGQPEDRFVCNVDGWACLKGTPEDLNFPKWRGIVPAVPKAVLAREQIGINAGLLATVQRALGTSCGVYLHFGATEGSPIMVGGLGSFTALEVRKPPFGIVMPMHVVDGPLAVHKQPVGAASEAGK